MTAPRTTNTTRRALTLLELILALTITMLVGAAMASVLTMISTGAEADRDGRSGALRAHAAQVRLHAYTDTARCILQEDPDRGFAVWLTDDRANDEVNLTELRVVWFDTDDGAIVSERVDLPDDWTELETQAYDVTIPDGSDYFTVMQTQNAAGLTTRTTLIDGVTGPSLEYESIEPIDVSRFRLRFTQEMDSGQVIESLISLALPEYEPPAS